MHSPEKQACPYKARFLKSQPKPILCTQRSNIADEPVTIQAGGITVVNFLLTNSYASGKFLMLLSAVVVIIAVLALFIKELRSTKLFCSLGLAAGSLTVIALSIIALEVLWPLMGLADIGKDYLATHTHLAGLTLIVGVLAIFACSLSVGLYSMIEILKMLKSRRKNK